MAAIAAGRGFLALQSDTLALPFPTARFVRGVLGDPPRRLVACLTILRPPRVHYAGRITHYPLRCCITYLPKPAAWPPCRFAMFVCAPAQAQTWQGKLTGIQATWSLPKSHPQEIARILRPGGTALFYVWAIEQEVRSAAKRQ